MSVDRDWRDIVTMSCAIGGSIAIGAIFGVNHYFSSQRFADQSKNPQPVVGTVTTSSGSLTGITGDSGSSIQQSASSSLSSTTNNTTITQEDAISLVKRWLNARSQMFAPPYDQEIGKDLATGKTYSDKIHGPSSDGTDTSTLEWLRKFDYYYKYNSFEIVEIRGFQGSGNEAILDLVLVDDRIQYDNRRNIVSKNSGRTKAVIRYRLKYDSDKWKISDIEELQKIKN
jgi:hypothetical protein